MARTPVLRRRLANDDIEAAINYYLAEAGVEIAVSFVKNLEEAIENISKHPAAGSLHYGYELQIPGMRYWIMKRFPYLVFYLEADDRIEIARVLQGRMDIPAQISEAQ